MFLLAARPPQQNPTPSGQIYGNADNWNLTLTEDNGDTHKYQKLWTSDNEQW